MQALLISILVYTNSTDLLSEVQEEISSLQYIVLKTEPNVTSSSLLSYLCNVEIDLCKFHLQRGRLPLKSASLL